MPIRQKADANLLSGDLVFGFIGRVEQEKGIETLLEATKQLNQPNWKLKIAGRGLNAYIQNLRRTYADLRIEWLGFTDSSEFYSVVDAIVIPSLWAEPLPYVVVESLHAGKSLICARSGGIPEIAQLSSLVEFFPAGDTNALAVKMNIALSSSQKWRENRVPDGSRLSAFREERVVENYLREYSCQEAKDEDV